MPVILLEGPDNSGKTTLANDLKERLRQPNLFPELEVNKSPIKDNPWSDNYNNFLINQSALFNGLLSIQDRTPEISESVYGCLRGDIRGSGVIYSVGDWIHASIFIIFCQNEDFYLMGRHVDAADNLLTDRDFRVTKYLYQLIQVNIERVERHFHPHSFRSTTYNWQDQSSHHALAIRLGDWLSYEFPFKEKEIRNAIQPGSVFTDDPSR